MRAREPEEGRVRADAHGRRQIPVLPAPGRRQRQRRRRRRRNLFRSPCPRLDDPRRRPNKLFRALESPPLRSENQKTTTKRAHFFPPFCAPSPFPASNKLFCFKAEEIRDSFFCFLFSARAADLDLTAAPLVDFLVVTLEEEEDAGEALCFELVAFLPCFFEADAEEDFEAEAEDSAASFIS